ncbi:hypothetical protein KC19_8G028100 [Ceratodon purpureus]|uniref:S-adenosyl-L-methionine-dependent methyltransferase n=1 Tax=Ceratodon purpureus TaxID=3225 RepID=A0A8T0GWX3_CERPU|nr:hypothetical protein KC19_8G028100 [Ceratodon purpureus]
MACTSAGITYLWSRCHRILEHHHYELVAEHVGHRSWELTMTTLMHSLACASTSRILSAHSRLFPAPGNGRLQLHGRRSPRCRQIFSRDLRPRAMEEDGPETEYKMLSEMKTAYDDLSILHMAETSSSKYAGFTLLVNNSGNILSMYKRDSIWTDLYFDEFATLPAVVPEGPIAILGLGGGTAARILLDVWPSRKLEGWEIDRVLVEKARLHLGLAALEVPNQEGGFLSVHIGDALSPEATVDGGFAGIVVDLFYQGEVLPELQEVQAWNELKKRLKPGGRIMVNCGGTIVEQRDSSPDYDDGTWTWKDGSAARDATISAIGRAFPEVNLRKMDSKEDNFLAMTGPLPDLHAWARAVPERVRPGVLTWRRAKVVSRRGFSF